MTRDEAEEIVVAVEVGFGDHYGITRGQYATALLVLQSDSAAEQTVAADLATPAADESLLARD